MAAHGTRGGTGQVGLPSGTLYPWVRTVEDMRGWPERWVEFTCAGCGRVFFHHAKVKRVVRNCSFECNLAYNDRIRGPLPRPAERRCKTCKNSVPLSPKGKARLYCDTCLKRRRKQQAAASMASRDDSTPRPRMITCADCEATVRINQSGPVPEVCRPCAAARRLANLRKRRRDRITYSHGHIYKCPAGDMDHD